MRRPRSRLRRSARRPRRPITKPKRKRKSRRKRLSSWKEESVGADAFNAPSEEDRPELDPAEGAMAEDDEFEETTELAPAESEAVRSEPSEVEEVADEEADASASHRADPSSPTASGCSASGRRRRKKKKRQRRSLPLRHQPMAGCGPRRGGNDRRRGIRSRAWCAPPQGRGASTGTFTRGTLPSHMSHQRVGEMFQERTSIIASSGISTSRTAKRKTRPARKRQPRRARSQHAAAIAAIAAHADAVRNAAVPRAAQRKPRICPSSRTC